MNPVFVAIDTPDLAQAQALAAAVAHHVGGLKLGLEFFAAHGAGGVAQLAGRGLPIFLDLKLHDIPNTVGKAVAALAPLAPALLTVHAAGGRAMLAAARAAAPASTRVIAVTMLTSLDAGDLADTGVMGTPGDHVLRLSALARVAGVDGIVCSGEEVASARLSWPDATLVVPGLRPADTALGDQKRAVTPAAALAAGASVLVIGRPITEASDPAAAARAIARSL
ncbi:orotidine-5'-phosphate decarboxylase [Sphingomonas aerophila]|jgi:orotidine-5'-phosphate decarboxylase|uniref:Orotidine 5'-phosphate decarboxylase n=1 Tax=Sphingomonas aerophila TaxID=1344948 RepID=A0A7W9BBF2_9SPHN|nr:orotidine-5'-phosphate decarboxylase [Sphingomonas aerophila]MBB5713894.1 orotidine-5'-phosphate decarboxylase [Sphingomonas aerophila]